MLKLLVTLHSVIGLLWEKLTLKLNRVGHKLQASFSGSFLEGTSQWGAADAEIKVPSGENTELKRSPFKAWSRSAYSHTCYAYCQGFLPCVFLLSQSIHLHFFQNLFRFLSCVGRG